MKSHQLSLALQSIVVSSLFVTPFGCTDSNQSSAGAPMNNANQIVQSYDGESGDPKIIAESQVIKLDEFEIRPSHITDHWNSSDVVLIKTTEHYVIKDNETYYLIISPTVLGNAQHISLFEVVQPNKMIIECTTRQGTDWRLLIDLEDLRFVYILPRN